MRRVVITTILALILGSIITSRSSPGDPVAWSDPNARTIAIIIGEKGWGIDELKRVAVEAVRHNGGEPQTNPNQTVVHITPKDENIMCEFTFSQGFDRPVWRVTIGYDGLVRKCEKGIRKEG